MLSQTFRKVFLTEHSFILILALNALTIVRDANERTTGRIM